MKMTSQRGQQSVALIPALLLAWLFGSLSTPVVFAAAFTNGSFELPGVPPPNATLELSAGSTNLVGWTIWGTGGPAYVYYSGSAAADGTNDIHFNANNQPSGTWIAQSFDTIVGANYDVTYFVGRGSTGGGVVSLTASARSQSASLLAQASSFPTSQGYESVQHLFFTAVSTNTTLEFRDTSTDTVGVDVLLDNVGVAVYVPRCATLPAGLVSWWPGEGNANDTQGTNNGTLANGASFASGEVNQAFDLNGTSQYVVIPDSPSLSITGAITVEAWINPRSLGGLNIIASQYNSHDQQHAWSFEAINGGHVEFGVHANGDAFRAFDSISSPIAIGIFTHVAATFDPNTQDLEVYVNGAQVPTVLVQGSTTVPSLRDSTTPIRLGAYVPGDGVLQAFFDGLIDEVSIYNRALSASEIRAIYAAGIGGKCSSTIPGIFLQPTNQVVVAGSDVTFAAGFSGAIPLFFQWRFNTTNILSGQTNSFLLLTNVSDAQAGLYSVVVSNSFGSVVSLNATLTVLDPVADDDGDGIINRDEVRFGTDPRSPDTDGDGLTDYDELFRYGTSPLKLDTDGDGIPDKWEVDHGLNPLVNDGNEDTDFDGVSNLQEFQYSQAHPTQPLDPHKLFSQTGVNDYATFTGGEITNRVYYDRNDRLLGLESSRGVSFAYSYDGNDNPVRQTVLSRASETNGLPALWSFLNGLTNNPSAYADTDGDGWTDYQEWKAGTNPRDAQSTPNLLGNPGASIASLTLPFTPSNFVVGVGQLDGSGAEEIVLGADGNPGATTNFLLVLTQTSVGWSTQRVDVGSFGITSIAIGQVTNRLNAGIYVGLRGATNGSGRVMEFTSSSGIWQSNVVALSTNQAAFVLGIRGQEMFVSLAITNAPDGVLFAVNFTTNWNLSLADPSTSRRGLGTVCAVGTQGDAGVRLLDGGGIAFYVGIVPTNFPPNAVYRPINGKWYFVTPTQMTWDDGLVFAQQHGGTLVAIEDASENDFVKVLNSSSELWIGLYRNPGSNKDNPSSWIWTSGSTSSLRNWLPGSPNSVGDSERWVVLHTLDGKWDDAASSFNRFAVGQLAGTGFRATEPAAISNVLWRGSSLASGLIRGTNGSSIFYSFADDRNGDGQFDAGDDFVTAEYLVSGTNATLLTLSRQPIASSTVAQSYGLASVNLLNTGSEVFFTGEPDGQVFAWTATSATNPLARQLFSADYSGKAWHALIGVKMAAGGEGLVGLMVDPTNQSMCKVVFWQPQAVLSSPQSGVIETAPAAAVLPSTDSLGNLALVTVRLWDAEGNASTPFLQYQISGSTNWQDATLVLLDAGPYAVTTRVAASPTGINHAVCWNAQTNLGMNISTNILLRARARDFGLLGDWSVGTAFQVNTATTPDSDNDGLPDWWELQYFHTIAANPNDDPDGDGFKNWQEYIADTNPTNTASHLSISVTLLSNGVKLDWLAGSNSWKYLKRTISVRETNPAWLNIWTSSPPPSPDSGSYTDAVGTSVMKFYRIQVERP